LICWQIKSYQLLERLKTLAFLAFRSLSKASHFPKSASNQMMYFAGRPPAITIVIGSPLRGLVAGSIGLKAMGNFCGALVFETFFLLPIIITEQVKSKTELLDSVHVQRRIIQRFCVLLAFVLLSNSD
jgi:hypothetical protein